MSARETVFQIEKTQKKGSSCRVLFSIGSGVDVTEIAAIVSQYVATILASGIGGVLLSHDSIRISARNWPPRVVATGTIALTDQSKKTGRTSVVFSTPDGEHLGSCDLSVIRLPPRIAPPQPRKTPQSF